MYIRQTPDLDGIKCQTLYCPDLKLLMRMLEDIKGVPIAHSNHVKCKLGSVQLNRNLDPRLYPHQPNSPL